jgi:hypothetical protein
MDNNSQHPFLLNSGINANHLPPQMIPLSQKNEVWKHQCMDSLELIGRHQWFENQKFYNNYKLVNGEFIPSDYGYDEQEYKDSLTKLSEDFDTPSFLKNYDIISQPLNTMVGELDAYPDTLRIVGKGDQMDNERMRIKSELTQKWYLNKIESEINLKLIERGLDPNFNEFETEEGQQQYLQQVNQAKEELKTPLQIQMYMNTSYRHTAEIWAETELEDQKQRFNLYDVRRTEFKDVLTVGRRFRHIYLKADGFGIETWNPINTFFHKSPEVKFIQNGDYVGQVNLYSLPAIIDRYGYLMSAKQLESLQQDYKNSYLLSITNNKALDGSNIDYNSPTGIPYATPVPTLNKFINENLPSMSNFPNGVVNNFMTDEIFEAITGGNSLNSVLTGMYQVTEGYWKSQKLIYKLYWINPETNVPEKILVDESFIVPNYIIKKEGSIVFNEEEDEINTMTGTWINEIWRGVKINNAGNSTTNSGLKKPIYLNIGRHDIQGKGETLIYEAVLPVGGQVVNNRNTTSASLVDMLKPFQFLYNIFMNQIYQYAEKEIAPFMLLDFGMLTNDKDWGGKKNLEKWMGVAKSLGIAPVDTSPSNMQGANAGGQLPKVIDLDMSQRMMTRFSLAQQIKQLALEQVGIAPQRLGDIKASETLGGANQATQRSYTQTSSWFTEFFAGERELMRMQLNVAQMLQAKGKDIMASAVHSDMSNTFLKFNDNEFSLYDLHIYVTNSQEELRNAELVQKLGIDNTINSKTSDRIKMVTNKSIPAITRIILESEREEMEMRKQQQAQADNQLKQQQEQFEKTIAKEDEHFYAKIKSDERREYIKANGFNENLDEDTDGNTIPDVLDQLKYISSDNMNKGKLANDSMKINNAKELSNAQLQLKREELANDRIKEKNKQVLEKEKLKRAIVQGDKSH